VNQKAKFINNLDKTSGGVPAGVIAVFERR